MSDLSIATMYGFEEELEKIAGKEGGVVESVMSKIKQWKGTLPKVRLVTPEGTSMSLEEAAASAKEKLKDVASRANIEVGAKNLAEGGWKNPKVEGASVTVKRNPETGKHEPKLKVDVVGGKKKKKSKWSDVGRLAALGAAGTATGYGAGKLLSDDDEF